MERASSKKRGVLALILLISAVLLTEGLVSATAVEPEEQALVQVAWQSSHDLARLEASHVPVYAYLTGSNGSYLLAGATAGQAQTLRAMGLDVTLLDPDMAGASYYWAYPLPGRPRPDWNTHGSLLLDDGEQVLLRLSPRDVAQLTAVGVEIVALDLRPITLHPQSEGAIPDTIHYDPNVEALLAQVDQATLYQYEEWLTGEEPADIGGAPYSLVTRYTHSGTPIQKATQFAYEHLEALGLDVEYHQWGGVQYPNVIATRPGQSSPDDIYIICAHLDDMPAGPLAPGADDNASGSAAVLMVADILSQYDFGCTLKFALWTGEEQGLMGSRAWAEEAHNAGLNILGVLNMDMIAYDSDASPFVDLHARSYLPDSLAIADVFSSVVGLYDIDLLPDLWIDDWHSNFSDNKPFWDEGYAAILVIEDDDDFTPYYHTVGDKLSTLNMEYFAEFVKASLGTFAHMSDCLVDGGIGSLHGQVSAADSGLPIADATVTMAGEAGYPFSAITDGTGYYTRTLTAGTYTVTASADGYRPTTTPGVVVPSDTVTALDLVLQPRGSVLSFYLPLVVRGRQSGS